MTNILMQDSNDGLRDNSSARFTVDRTALAVLRALHQISALCPNFQRDVSAVLNR
jgi:hypothetical protein